MLSSIVLLLYVYVLLDVIAGRRVGADKLQHTLRVSNFEVVITPRAYIVFLYGKGDRGGDGEVRVPPEMKWPKYIYIYIFI